MSYESIPVITKQLPPLENCWCPIICYASLKEGAGFGRSCVRGVVLRCQVLPRMPFPSDKTMLWDCGAVVLWCWSRGAPGQKAGRQSAQGCSSKQVFAGWVGSWGRGGQGETNADLAAPNETLKKASRKKCTYKSVKRSNQSKYT